MAFRLVPKSVTVTDLGLCNGHYIVDTRQLNHGSAVLLAVAELLVLFHNPNFILQLF